jgi:hypothetical protein
MKTTANNINEISDAEVLAILNGFMDEEAIAKKEEKARVRRAKKAVKTEIAFHICLQSIEKGLRK